MIDALDIRVHGSLAAVAREIETPGLAGYAFGRLAWLQAWHAAFGDRDAMQIAIVTVADTRLRMVLPLGVARQRGLRVLTFLGAPVSDYNAPLVEPAFAEALDAAAVENLWARIRALLPRHDVVRLLAMPEMLDTQEGAGAAAVPNPLARLAGAQAAGVAQSVALPDTHEALLKSLKTTFVADTRRRRRRLGEAGPVSFVVAETEAEMQNVVTALKRMKSRRWRDTKATDAFADAGFTAFYDSVGRLALPEGRVHGSLLMVGDAPVAVHLGLAYRSRFYCLMLGWESGDWQRFGTGRLIVDAMMRSAIDDGLKVFDFTGGDEAYKGDWVDTELRLLRYEVPTTRRGHVALTGLRMLARARAGAKEVVWLRAAVRRLTGRPPLPPVQRGRG